MFLIGASMRKWFVLFAIRSISRSHRIMHIVLDINIKSLHISIKCIAVKWQSISDAAQAKTTTEKICTFPFSDTTFANWLEIIFDWNLSHVSSIHKLTYKGKQQQKTDCYWLRCEMNTAPNKQMSTTIFIRIIRVSSFQLELSRIATPIQLDFMHTTKNCANYSVFFFLNFNINFQY